LEALPADAVRTIGTDCAVDFAPLLNYVELAPDANQANGKPTRFTGVADGQQAGGAVAACAGGRG